MSRLIFALVDCNSFYVSCERVFAPQLRDKPVVVLSNNDGCIVSRSQEVKDLGLPMASPVFKLRHLIRRHRIHTFSSNYTLYADMSRRVMETLETFSPEIEVYSIDEAFLTFTGMEHIDLDKYARTIRDTVVQWTGIPVSVGIGPSKTLAKLANRYAKKNRECEGAFNITDHPDIDTILESVKVGDVWGVGRKYRDKLNKVGVYNARQLRDLPDKWARANMTVVGLRTVHELRGIPCYEVEPEIDPKKGIVTSRSFGKPLEDEEAMCEAVAAYAARAAVKLRRQKSVVSCMTIFIITNPFRKEQPQYANSASWNIEPPTADTPQLIAIAKKLLRKIYRPGYKYKKAGVMLTGIRPEGEFQLDAFATAFTDDRRQKLMRTLDDVNRRYGMHTLSFASEGIQKPWQMKRDKLSQRFTTNWKEIPVVKAD